MNPMTPMMHPDMALLFQVLGGQWPHQDDGGYDDTSSVEDACGSLLAVVQCARGEGEKCASRETRERRHGSSPSPPAGSTRDCSSSVWPRGWGKVLAWLDSDDAMRSATQWSPAHPLCLRVRCFMALQQAELGVSLPCCFLRPRPRWFAMLASPRAQTLRARPSCAQHIRKAGRAAAGATTMLAPPLQCTAPCRVWGVRGPKCPWTA